MWLGGGTWRGIREWLRAIQPARWVQGDTVTISELIAALEDVRDKHGDIPCEIEASDADGLTDLVPVDGLTVCAIGKSCWIHG